MKKIIPAILTDNIADLDIKLEQIKGLVDWVQIDIIDGKFVDNTSITLKDIVGVTVPKDFSLEAHLMVENPELYIKQCQKSNIKRVMFQKEAVGGVEKALALAGELKLQKGLAIKPKTPISELQPYISNIDAVLLMSVEPGFQGQPFISATLDKIRELRSMAPNIIIEVDGGINLDNIKAISDAGADCFVVGSALFNSDDIQETFKKLNEAVK